MATILPSRARPAMPWAARRAGDDYGVQDEPDWRTIDWREHTRDIELSGRRVRYAEMGATEASRGTGGDEPPFVLVHGISGNWQNWLENIPRLARERRTIALDLPGFGQSDDPAGEITMSGYGRTVEELCDRLGLGEIVLVGNSMGGFVAAETAIQFPERVERLLLCSAAGVTTSDLRREPAMVWGRLVTMAGARSAAETRMAILRPRLRHAVFSAIVRHPSLISAELLWEISMGAGRSAFMPALHAILDYDYRDRLPDIRCPTLVVWGENDMIIPVRDANEYERQIRGARKVVMKDTGHVPMMERPRTFNRLVLEFASEPRGEQTGDVGVPTAEAARNGGPPRRAGAADEQSAEPVG